MSNPTKYGILGYPLGHSFSKPYFEKKFEILGFSTADYVYQNYEINNHQDVKALITQGYIRENLQGLSVTIPYKRAAYELVDCLSEEARAIGAVNCIFFDHQSGQSKGYNTDAIGFELSLLSLLGINNNSACSAQIEHMGIKALVLGGSGGAGAAVRFVLDRLGINFMVVTRNVEKNSNTNTITYDQLDNHILDQYKLIINATPVGMWPHIDDSPLPSTDGIGAGHYIFDLIYNPPITKLMQECAKRGAKTTNGMSMLELQAEAAWEIWNSHKQ